jgi:acyl-ACP thioesterase
MKCDPANPKGSGVVNMWQETFPVRFSAIDRSNKLTLNAALQYFQEVAICHAENIGVGREAMAKTGQAWILSRMTVIIDRRPEYCENITIRTWPKGGEKLFAIRNYDIRDKDDNAIITGRSAWLVVDMEKRRPLRPQSIIENLPINEGVEALPPGSNGTASITERNNLQKAAERGALYTDVDYNGHVNNVRYIQWIEDTLDPQVLESANKLRLDINYLHEILGGETTEILSAPIDDPDCCAFAFEGCKKEGSQTAFRAELRLWR